MHDRELVHAIDDLLIVIDRREPHQYALTLNVNLLDVSCMLTTDDCANLADALLVISDADRAARMAERRRQRKGK